jgi:hypothetical protein
MNSTLQTVNGAPDRLELCMIVRRDGRFSLTFQLANARFDRALVDADDGVMFVLNAQRFCERYDEMVFVQLRVSLNCLVLDAFRYVAQLGQCLVSELFVC